MRKLTPFGKEIYKVLIDKDMWPSDLAKELGITTTYLGDILTGNKKATKVKARICKLLEIKEGEVDGGTTKAVNERSS